MPRKLPWQTSTSTAVARTKRPALPSSKRQKVATKNGDSDDQADLRPSVRKERADLEDPRSSSPPPDPPPESFMIEGMDDDDKYRMVEDQFLTIAQKFTVHLHAAEYKRQQKIAKTRNAETISSISRPVAGKMPDQTKRKVEAVERAKAQKSVLEGLIGKKVGDADISDDSDDGDGLPYVGTSLHGLMDSPRRKATSLSKVSAAATTRAAAGYKQSAQARRMSLGSPQFRLTARSSQSAKVLEDDATESSADDGDLDAAPKLESRERKPTLVQKLNLVSEKRDSKTSDLLLSYESRAPRSKHSTSDFIDVPKTVKTEISSPPPKQRERMSRSELARARRKKEEEEEKAKAKLDIIPGFL
ncbi:uncharacterized protein LY89DRAFT_669776 [Mollisia scopiformis]|uniref:Uncharacterized protein n=1 Tax=Mollisia scopiformis TaxID=149040 RepID=A0A194X8X9_MOLSC|nr:uncharacterized protein LY89DRAFT_669776 [Mollisia scopiformis]KUJ16242.1 hypothetical protein LY89DRAFT_669776 [Mollisia scopiformis]